MMNNLFMMFDPTSNFFSMNWMSCFLPAFLTMKYYFTMTNRVSYLNKNINNFINKDLCANMNKTQWKTKILLTTIFFLICMLNLLGLIPFIFTPTSHMSMTLFLSLPLWMALMMFMLHKNINLLLKHLVPMGTPFILIPFMVVIETISLLIRPITLMIRLMANMIAGHILICLISKLMLSNTSMILTISIALNMLMVLEISVAMIQAYVFIILMSLYIKETK